MVGRAALYTNSVATRYAATIAAQCCGYVTRANTAMKTLIPTLKSDPNSASFVEFDGELILWRCGMVGNLWYSGLVNLC
jgi:hypothetical protein